MNCRQDSPYRTEEFTNNGHIFPTREENEKILSPEEYVGTICDVLRMKKNICLCRHFHLLNKSEIAGNIKQNRIKYIDVWPVNVFEPKNEDPFDVVSLFMMQLACIINMLPVWKNLHLRLFLCETENSNGSSSNFNINSLPYDRPAEYKLKELLKQLRISATIHQVPEWTQNVDFMKHCSILKQFTRNSDPNINVLTDENINRSKLYMQR